MVSKIEKVREAMGVCKMKQCEDCQNCPYREEEWDGAWEDEDGFSCYDEMAADALDLLAVMEAMFSDQARLLTEPEIAIAPDRALLYEEVRVDWGDPEDSPSGQQIETDIAPVEKRGEQLVGNGVNRGIGPGMFTEGEDNQVRIRYWLGRPSEEQRENTPWEGAEG